MYELTKEYLAVVKLTGPGHAHRASGSLASEITFTNWKGRAYAKKHAKPKQPRTDVQVTVRAMMSFLSRAWANTPPAAKATWEPFAAQTGVTAFNAYQSYNLENWQEFRYPTQAYPYVGTGSLCTVSSWQCLPIPSGCYNSIVTTVQRDGWALAIHHRLGPGTADEQKFLVHMILTPVPATYRWTMRDLPAAIGHKFWLTWTSIDGRAYSPGLYRNITVPP